MIPTRLMIAPALLAASIVAAPVVRAQAPESPKDPVETVSAPVNAFFQSVIAGQVDEAFKQLLVGSPLASPTSAAKKKAVAALVVKTKDLSRLYGEARAFESVEQRMIGKDVVVLKYLYKCERFPVVWYFTYYRDQKADLAGATRQWFLISVRFDTAIDRLAM